jgi:hypothetical protein
MRRFLPFLLLATLLTTLTAWRGARAAENAKWPLSLREGLPASLPGWAANPSDPLPDEDENAMGRYTEVARFFQKIESTTSAKQFRLTVQDYGAGKDLAPQLKKAFSDAAASGVETRSVEIAGRRAYSVTDRSSGRPTTIVTVIVSPSRLVLGEGANVAAEEALALVRSVDFTRVAGAR